MAKTLALFFDGTWNGPEKLNSSLLTGLIAEVRYRMRRGQSSTATTPRSKTTPVTNVLKLLRAVLPSRQTIPAACSTCHRPLGRTAIPATVGDPQISLYFNGIGTDPSPLFQAIEGAFGYGIDRDIQQGYQFVAQNFEDGDNLYLFGFSRGAFTARALAGFIDAFGMIPPAMMPGLPELYKQYMEAAGKGGLDLAKATARDHLRGEHKTIAIWFLGVWDTVGALWRTNPNHARAHQVELPSNVHRAYQALALDEVRTKFEPVLWEHVADRSATEVQQVWFPGAHADVGGGYDETGLSDIALRWMACKAMEAGLALDLNVLKPIKPDVRGPFHDSHQGKALWGMPDVRHLLPKDFPGTAGGFWHTIGLHESATHTPNLILGDYVNASALNTADPGLIRALIDSHRRRADLERTLDPKGPGVVHDACVWP